MESLPVQKVESLQRTLDDPTLFINREVSWINFNNRVLEETQDHRHPLLERVKFLAISGSNLDEFFMTRASVLKQQIERGDFELTPGSRMTPQEQIKVTRQLILPLLKNQNKCLEELLPSLAREGIRILKPNDMTKRQNLAIREYFRREILPVMKKPNQEYSSAYVSNLRINLLVVAKDPRLRETTAKLIVEAPTDNFDRLVRIPASSRDGVDNFILLEDVIGANLDLLFPSTKIIRYYKFRVTRNAEIDVKADEDSDFLTTVELSVRQRRYGKPARLEFESSMPRHLRAYLAESLGSVRVPQRITEDVQYEIDGALGLVDLWQLLKLNRPALKDTPFKGYIIPELALGRAVFKEIAAKDFSLYHPYDSFDMIVNLFESAATDHDVTDIYITLYRSDPNSPIVAALKKAASNGKRVTVLIELKAKFDEVNNINLAKVMSQAGVKVVYNFPKIKIHAKIALIVRKENGKLIQYSHIGSGNYNSITTRIYGDIAYLTANPQIGTEVLDLFHKLTSDVRKPEEYKYLLVSPTSLKSEILRRIEREINQHQKMGKGYLAFKVNGLVDKQIIQALYRASQAGVKIELNVRGMCCLRPGIPGISENISVISIVGRFLEHARIYYFWNGGEDEVLLGSSDMMPRNLERRVEVLFSVPDPMIRSSILKILMIHLKDNVKARRLLSDGSYEYIKPAPGGAIIDSQRWLIENRGIWHAETRRN
ncbi:MAG TPA: polyphosphate kinase 1 [Candidatus Bathyarchaeia archaeon]|nr:polyphosphate kinase 1 [Candidatus Bathyarchaeia archaeon]